MTLAILLPRDAGCYKRTDAVGVRMWVKNGFAHQWSVFLERFGIGNDEILLPSAAGSGGHASEGYLLSTGGHLGSVLPLVPPRSV